MTRSQVVQPAVQDRGWGARGGVLFGDGAVRERAAQDGGPARVLERSVFSYLARLIKSV